MVTRMSDRLALPRPAGTISESSDAQSLLAGYEQLLNAAPSPPDAGAVYRGTIAYEAWVNQHPDYKSYLDKLRALEIAMRGAVTRRPENTAPASPAELPIAARVSSAISRRRDQLGYLYVDEYHQISQSIQEKQAEKLAPQLGDQPGVKPHSPEEKTALKSGELKDVAGPLGTITNRLQEVKGLKLPDNPDEPIQGLRRVTGYTEFLPVL